MALWGWLPWLIVFLSHERLYSKGRRGTIAIRARRRRPLFNIASLLLAKAAYLRGGGCVSLTRSGCVSLTRSLRRAAQRAFINLESLLRPAGVNAPFFATLVPAAFLLAAHRAFIISASLLRPAGVSAPFFLALTGFVRPFNLAQRALAAAESFARAEGEK